MEDDRDNLLSTNVLSRRNFLFGLASVMVLSLDRKAEAAGLFEPFNFAYVTDAHLTTGQPDSYKLLQESQLFLQDVVKQLNDEQLDFVIFGGDQVEGPGKDDTNWQLFIDVVQTLNAPWNFVLGESDVSGPISVDKLRTYGPDWKGKGLTTSKTYWSQDPLSGVHIIGLDTARPNLTEGGVSTAQMAWLKDDLARHQRRFTIVFSHHPLLPPPPYHGGPPWDDYIVTQGASVREVLGGSKYVRLVVNGHVHVTKVQQERDIWYLSRPSLAVYPCAYSIFRVSPDAIVVETYQVGYPALIKKAKRNLISSPLAYKYNSHKPALFASLAEGGRLDTDVSLPLLAGKPVSPLGKRKPKKSKARSKPADKKSKTKSKPGSKEKEKEKLKETPEVKEAPEIKGAPEVKEAPDVKGAPDATSAPAAPDAAPAISPSGSP